ncbi:hypothetical protein [Streptomyces sp. LN785]|uniref:hypothetical protein n=1 Tax=Streptomyces sp. LN785 TaxID=3112983 RepID=UPI00372338FA
MQLSMADILDTSAEDLSQPRRRHLVPAAVRLSDVAFTTPEYLMKRIRDGLPHIQYRNPSRTADSPALFLSRTPTEFVGR